MVFKMKEPVGDLVVAEAVRRKMIEARQVGDVIDVSLDGALGFAANGQIADKFLSQRSRKVNVNGSVLMNSYFLHFFCRQRYNSVFTFATLPLINRRARCRSV